MELVGMDEKSFLRGQDYVSMLYDLTPGQSRVLEVMDGHDAGAVQMLWEIIPDDVLEKIKAVRLDMSGTFASVTRTMAPHVKIVYDRFHVSKHLNEAVALICFLPLMKFREEPKGPKSKNNSLLKSFFQRGL